MKLVFSLLTFACAILQSVNGAVLNYEIKTTWDNISLPSNETTFISFSKAEKVPGLLLTIDAPWNNDPLPTTPVGSLDGLWHYEVVEVYFLGSDVKYLEVEFGPGGHYLVYYLEGIRHSTFRNWTLNDFTVNINKTSRRWSGTVTIPTEYFPPNVAKFNAYAMRGSEADGTRVHHSLFPVPHNSAPGYEFHNLDPFQPVDLSSIIEIKRTSTG